MSAKIKHYLTRMDDELLVRDGSAQLTHEEAEQALRDVYLIAHGDAPEHHPRRLIGLTENGIEAVAAERKRQIEQEGWTAEHDDQHTDETLALVAALYATPVPLYSQEIGEGHILFDDPWPTEWDDAWDKRDKFDRRRRLVIAGALICAEIDRLDRETAGEHINEERTS